MWWANVGVCVSVGLAASAVAARIVEDYSRQGQTVREWCYYGVVVSLQWYAVRWELGGGVADRLASVVSDGVR